MSYWQHITDREGGHCTALHLRQHRTREIWQTFRRINPNRLSSNSYICLPVWQSSAEGRREGGKSLICILTLLQVKTTAYPNLAWRPLMLWLIKRHLTCEIFNISSFPIHWCVLSQDGEIILEKLLVIIILYGLGCLLPGSSLFGDWEDLLYKPGCLAYALDCTGYCSTGDLFTK